MSSTKFAVTALGFMIIFLLIAFNAAAQWSPGGEMVYMGDLNLAAPSVSGGTASQAVGGTQLNQLSMNNSTMNNMTINNTSMNS